MKVIVGIAIAMLALVVDLATADACICGKSTICDRYWSADVVFVGRATNVKHHRKFHIEYINGKPVTVLDGGGTESAVFVVETTLRGAVAATQLVKGTAGCGSVELDDNERYLVYANLDNGEYVMHGCSETKPVSEASEDLAFVRSLPTKKLATITGFVDTNHAPLASKVTVGLRGAKTTVKTDNGGYFSIDVPTGSATIEVVDPLLHAKPLTVAIPTPGMCKLASIDARWIGVARGRLVDHRGNPAANMEIVSEYTKSSWEASSTRTGPDGRYEVTNLKPGMPFMISTAASAHADHPYKQTYLTDPSGTRPMLVTVPTSGVVDKLDFALPEPLPVYDSVVIVRGPRGLVANATVKVRAGYHVVEVTTDAKGRAAFRHLSAKVQIEACTTHRGRDICGVVERTLAKPTTLNLRIR